MLLSYQHLFPTFGIEITTKKNFDIIITDYYDEFLEIYKKPIIFCERIDCCMIRERNLLLNPLVIGFFKEYNPRDLEYINTKITIKNRYHCKILSDIFNLDPKNYNYKICKPIPKIPKKDLKKIKTINWNWSQYTHLSNGYHMKYFREKSKQLYHIKKDVDVFLCCRERHSMDGFARTFIKNKINKMNIKHVIHSSLGRQKYIEMLSRSKICIAPWGYGEWIALDHYAMYSGAILIKPNTDYMEAYPDIYQSNKYYIACKWDYSDIEEKIKDILKNYEKYEYIRKNARKILVKCNYNCLIDKFCSTIKNIYNNYNESNG